MNPASTGLIKLQRKLPLWAVLVISIIVTPGLVLDTFTTGKFTTLSIFAMMILTIHCIIVPKSKSKLSLKIRIVIILFVSSLLIPIIFAPAPLIQQIYGVWGRNTGLLYYLSLTTFFLSASRNSDSNWIREILKSLFIVVEFELIYSTLQVFNVFELRDTNQFGWITGTFGNPDYLSSFLGITFILNIYYSATPNKSFTHRAAMTFNALWMVFVIYKTQALQGFILILSSIVMTFLLLVLTKKKALLLKLFTFSTTLCLGVLTIFGILQKGPFRNLLYQDSITFRGDYWRAGFRMGLEHFWTGVGLNSYGDYYRQFRDVTAAARRIPDVVSNSSHNIFLDLFSSGGIFLVSFYLAIVILTLISGVVKFYKTREPEFLIVLVIWINFNLQNQINVDSISHSTWSWILSGAICGYSLKENIKDLYNVKLVKTLFEVKIALTASAFICLIFVGPYYMREVSLTSALKENSPAKLLAASTKFPLDSSLMARSANSLLESKQSESALKLSFLALRFNVRDFDAVYSILKNPIENQNTKNLMRIKLLDIEPNATIMELPYFTNK